MNPYIGPAGEFYVLATLYRLGLDATITLGTTKSIDIVLRRTGRPAATIDVKASADKNLDFLVGKNVIFDDADHFYVFTYFGRDFASVTKMPEMYVVPSTSMSELIRTHKGLPQMNGSALRQSDFRDAWHLLNA